MADNPLQPKAPTGPIPGENYTSDTKNYPWHRPPSITDMDSAVEAVIKQLTKKDTATALLTMLQSGVTVVQAADIFTTTGIGKGLFTPDFALLLAGPTTHMMKLMADGYGIKYDMGLDNVPKATINYVKAKAEIDPNKAVTAASNITKELDALKKSADDFVQQQHGGNMPNAAPPGSPMGADAGGLGGPVGQGAMSPNFAIPDPKMMPMKSGTNTGGFMTAPPPADTNPSPSAAMQTAQNTAPLQ